MGKIPSGGIETDAMLCMVMGNNFIFLGGMAQAMMIIQTHLVRTRIIEENIKSQRNLAIKSLILQRNQRKRKIEGDRLATCSITKELLGVNGISAVHTYMQLYLLILYTVIILIVPGLVQSKNSYLLTPACTYT